MERDAQWRELYRTSDPAQAHMLATCIEGMEFEVRVRDALGRVIDGSDAESQPSLWPPIKPPFIIDVPQASWLELREVVNELIEEQAEFDSRLEAQRQRSTRVAQLLVLSAVTLIASFAGATMLKQCEADRP